MAPRSPTIPAMPQRSPVSTLKGNISLPENWREHQTFLRALPRPELLRSHLDNWKRISEDSVWIRNIVTEGLKLHWDMDKEEGPWGSPSPNTPPPPYKGELRESLQAALDKDLSNGTVRRLHHEGGEGVYHYYFPILKPDGSARPCSNLKFINKRLPKMKFKMETQYIVGEQVLYGDWAITIDIKSAFNHVPIHKDYRRFFRFVGPDGHLYEFQSMNFGSSVAPATWHRLFSRVIGTLRSMGIRVCFFMDDMKVLASTRAMAREHGDIVCRYLTAFGFLINLPKSNLEPTQLPRYLGLLWDLNRMTVSLPKERIRNIKKAARQVLATSSIARIQRLMGHVEAARMIFQQARMHSFEFIAQTAHMISTDAPRDTIVPLSDDALTQVKWWIRNASHFNQVPIKGAPAAPIVDLTTDASPSGWGAELIYKLAQRTSSRGGVEHYATRRKHKWGRWSQRESQLHSNERELLAVVRATANFHHEIEAAVRTYYKSIPDPKQPPTLMFRSDNTTAVSYVRRIGGRLAYLNRCLRPWARRISRLKEVVVQAEHIPGKDIPLVDGLSRRPNTKRAPEWCLHQTVFNGLNATWGPFHCDLFASESSFKMTPYLSRHRTPPPPNRTESASTVTDAFSVTWNQISDQTTSHLYAFPPIQLIHRVLRRARQEAVELTIVVPSFDRATWWPLLLQDTDRDPIILPSYEEGGFYRLPSLHDNQRRPRHTLVAFHLDYSNRRQTPRHH